MGGMGGKIDTSTFGGSKRGGDGREGGRGNEIGFIYINYFRETEFRPRRPSETLYNMLHTDRLFRHLQLTSP